MNTARNYTKHVLSKVSNTAFKFTAVGLTAGLVYHNRDTIKTAIQDNMVVSAAPNIPTYEQTPSASKSTITQRVVEALPSKIVNVNRGRVTDIHVAQYNANNIIEDTFHFLPELSSDDGVLVGVFDGHGGRAASAFCRDELLRYLDFFNYVSSGDDILSPKSFVTADDHFLTLAERKDQLRDGISGACVAVSHIKGNKIRTASAGDCRVVVGRNVSENTPYYLPSRVADGPMLETPPMTDYFNYEKPSGFFSMFSSAPEYTTAPPPTDIDHRVSGMKGEPVVPIELAAMHQIDFNQYETMRLLHNHPGEADVILNDRVKGGLQPTRGFGDGTYKRMVFFDRRYAKNSAKASRRNNWSIPYTTVEPEISNYTLHNDDQFMVLSSDGLLEDLSPDQVVKHVSDYLADSSLRSTYPNAGLYLIHHALIAASHKVIGKRSDIDNLNWVTSIKAGDRRYIHDDITAMVVFFTKDGVSDAKTDKKPPMPKSVVEMRSARL